MNTNYLYIDPNHRNLKFYIKKDSELNFFQLFMIGLLTIGHIIIALFLYNSLVGEGLFGAKVVFVIFGLFGLFTINRQLREILIFIKGDETIEINDSTVRYNGEFLMFKKTGSLKLSEIKKLDLKILGSDKFSQSSNMFAQIKYGIIVIEKSRKKKIAFGQTLTKEEIETLFEKL